MKEILVNEEGYNQFFEELEKLKCSLISNASTGSEAYKNAVGDGWHDNFAYEEAMREERSISAKIDKMNTELALLKIMDEKGYFENKVNLNDTVTLIIKYDIDDEEKQKIKLTGKYLPSNSDDDEVKEISLNSPLGRAIYLQDIKSTVTYMVEKREIEVTILNKL